MAIVDAYGVPQRRAGPGRLPRPVRPARLHDGQRLPAGSSTRTAAPTCPASTSGWAQEQALDLDAVSATCPDCKIVLVQAKSASFANLGTAVNTAAQQPGVVAISNSYGGSDAPDSTYGSYYNHPGIAVTASTGDNGYQGGSYPASSHTSPRSAARR